jgi:hypothetical protein
MRVIASVIAALFLSSNFVHAAFGQDANASDPIKIGPIQVGMSLQDLRAALPDATWTEEAERGVLGRRVFKARDALPLFGRRYDVEVGRGEGTDYGIWIRREESVSGMRECEDLGLSLISSLEDLYGVFRQIVTVPDFRRACFDSKESICAGAPVLETPGGSKIARMAKDASGSLIRPQDNNASRIHVLALGGQIGFGPRYSDTIARQDIHVGARYEAGSCRLSVQVDRLSLE